MTNKIENTSGNKEDYIRRDFASHTQSDKYGNKATRDNAGNVILNNNKEKEEKDFSYQKKYNLISRIDSECGYYVDASILDDCFIETLIEKTKNLISSGKKMEVKYLPQEEGEEKKHEIKEKDIDIGELIKKVIKE